ncbi:MAG: hypothetical protein Q9195_005728 [Heterodermia aff. obscurata]
MAAGLKTIIALSFILAIGFLLVILSCALWHEYLPLLVVATYVLAPLPNWICSRCSNPDDFMESAGSAVVDFGRFCTAFLVVMGIGMHISPSLSRAAGSSKHRVADTGNSSPDSLGSYWAHRGSGHGHVDHRWSAHLRDDHKLHFVFPRRARFLSVSGKMFRWKFGAGSRRVGQLV